MLMVRQSSPPKPGFAGLGLMPMVDLAERLVTEIGPYDDEGVVVASVTSNGPADLAGLKPGDVMLRYAGIDVPDLNSAEPEPHRLWRVAVRLLMDHVWAGEPVPVEIERNGERMGLHLVPITASELHRLQADELARILGGLPNWKGAGSSREFRADLEAAAEEDRPLPEGFYPYEGRWRVATDPKDQEHVVLRQDKTVLPWAVLLIAGPGLSYRDGKASVRMCPISGVQDASGGLVFRAQDPKNYYVARPSALERNFRIYRLRDGVRSQLATISVEPPRKGTWHTVEVEFEGTKLKATLDGEHVVTAEDDTFSEGWCGLWTKADSVTVFDELSVAPLVSVSQ